MGFDVVFINVTLLIALSIPGYLLRKLNLFGKDSVKVLVLILIYAAQPAMVGKSFLKEKYNADIGLNILFVVTAFAAVMLAVLCIAAVIFRRRKGAGDGESAGQNQKAENNRLYRFAAMFGNTGYLGLPMIAALFPGNDKMILYTGLCIVLFNILSWTVGVWVITGDKKNISLKKCLLTPVIITTLLTIPFFFMQSVTVPAPIVKFFDILGSMTTPLSMFIMGARMAEIPFKEIFTDGKVYISTFLRLLVAPAIALGILKLFGRMDTDTHNTLMIICMMPSAASTIIFAEKFLTNSYTAIKAVLLSSILCIITIPLICIFTIIL